MKPAKASDIPSFWFATIVTAVYLIFELGFNARLLDIAGTMPSQKTLDNIEVYGRILSGMGASLVLWRLIGAKFEFYWPPGLFYIAIVVVPVVYWGQYLLVETLVGRATPQERRFASYLTMVSTATLQNAGKLKGLNLTDAEYGSADGKAFFALFPALAYSSTGLMKQVDASVMPLVVKSIEKQVGKPEIFYNKHYVPTTNEIRELYNNQYVPASNKIRDGAARSFNAWEEYLEETDKNRVNIYKASEWTRVRVVRKLHEKGINVPADWKLHDRVKFMDVTGPVGEFWRQTSKQFGFNSLIHPGLEWKAFSLHDDIQKLIKNKLKDKVPTFKAEHINIDLDANFDQFHSKIYKTHISEEAHRKVQLLRSSDKSFQEGGASYDIGQRAMHAVLVPPLALFFSLFFALTNLISLLVGMLPLGRIPSTVLKTALYCGVIFAPLTFTNSVTRSEAYEKLERQAAIQSPLLTYGIRWVAQTAPLLYPVTSLAPGVVSLEHEAPPASNESAPNNKLSVGARVNAWIARTLSVWYRRMMAGAPGIF
jgi:hypothetical protein